MIYIAAAKLVILAQQKTGSVALENALTGRSGWSIRRPDKMKHMTYFQFQQWFAPPLKEIGGLSRGDYDVVGIMREPMDWYGSVFRFNSRERLKNDEAQEHRYLGDVLFEDFIRRNCRNDNPGQKRFTARLPCGVFLDEDGRIGVDRIYPYENISELVALIESTTGAPIPLKRVNVSPPRDLDLTDETRALFEKTYASVIALHAALRPDGVIEDRFRSVVFEPDFSQSSD